MYKKFYRKGINLENQRTIDNYLKIFENLFFDIEKNENIKSVIEQISSVLASIITKYGEIVNEISYGCSGQDDFIDTVVCLFVRKIMEHLDAINVLFSVGSVDPTQIILRTLIENIIGLEFILKENTEERAAAYYLEHHYQEMTLAAEYFDKNSTYGKQIIASKGEAQFNNDYAKYKKKRDALKRLVDSKEVFQKVNKARNKKLNQQKKGNKRKIQWYEVCSNISNFRELMRETGYEKYYQSIYGGFLMKHMH